MHTKQLKAFVAMVKLGSASKAGKALGISTSSMSRLLLQLEDELGVCLIERTTRSQHLTTAGDFFFEKAQEIISIYDNTKKNLCNLNDSLSGNIKIGIQSSLSYLYITQCIHEFLELYPKISIQLVNGDHLLDLLDHDYDFVLHCRALPSSDFHYRKICTWTRSLCASPRYIAKYGLPNTIENLDKHNCLLHYENKGKCWPLLVNDKIKKIYVDGNISTDSSLNLKNLAVNGVGIAYLPSFTILNELNENKLIKILSKHSLPNKHIYAVYTKNRRSIKRVTVFLDFLTKKMNTQMSVLQVVNRDP